MMTEYQSKQINRRNRIREKRKIILIGCEGNNKTEKLYFSSYNRVQKEYIVKFSFGNNTDLFHIVLNIKRCEKEIGFDSSIDSAFAIYDVDNDKNKIKLFEDLNNQKDYKNINFIPSNPCFELWYLLHFVYTTKLFHSNEELIKELEKYIPNYDKSKDYFDHLFLHVDKAIKNNENLVKYARSVCNKNVLENSYTNVFDIVKILHNSIAKK